MVEKSGIEKSGVVAWGWKVQGESLELKVQGWNVLQTIKSVMEDVASMMETVWNMTAFEG